MSSVARGASAIWTMSSAADIVRQVLRGNEVSQTLANWLVGLTGIYAGLGVAFAIAFCVKGVGRVDESAGEGTWGFRVLIFPGAAALWPLLLKRWIGGRREPPVETNPHRARAGKAAL